MWPVMTLTLLLQLTDDEQLYAEAPLVQPVKQQQEVVAPPVEEQKTAAWPETDEVATPDDCRNGRGCFEALL